jgi:hypothetical protein
MVIRAVASVLSRRRRAVQLGKASLKAASTAAAERASDSCTSQQTALLLLRCKLKQP